MQSIPPKVAKDYGLNDKDVRNALQILRQMPSEIREIASRGSGPDGMQDSPWWYRPEPTECYYATILSILQKLNLVANNILEVGCDEGYFVAVLSFLGSHAVGLDKNEDALKNTEEVQLIHGLIEQPPAILRRQKFDVSILNYPSNRREYNLVSFLAGARHRIGI